MSQKPTPAQWAGTRRAEQLLEIACPGSPGRCGPGAHLGRHRIWNTRVTDAALWDTWRMPCLFVSVETRRGGRCGRPTMRTPCVETGTLHGLFSESPMRPTPPLLHVTVPPQMLMGLGGHLGRGQPKTRVRVALDNALRWHRGGTLVSTCVKLG